MMQALVCDADATVLFQSLLVYLSYTCQSVTKLYLYAKWLYAVPFGWPIPNAFEQAVVVMILIIVVASVTIIVDNNTIPDCLRHIICLQLLCSIPNRTTSSFCDYSK